MRPTPAFLLAAAASTAAFASDWSGPGWYEVFYAAESGYMIWYPHPFADQASCDAYVKNRFSDKAYAESMGRKYGPRGDHDNGFEISCVEMRTASDAPPDD